MERLTRKQAAVLATIRAILEEEGVPPTLRELAARLGLDVKSVAQHLDRLERKGYLERKAGLKSRAIALTHQSGKNPRSAADLVSIPLLGRVAAGLPVLAEENYEDEIHLDRDMLPGSGPLFALTVTGDSMIEKGIHDGDMVFVRKQATARAGQVVVALIDGEATVKTYRPSARAITFEAANPAYPNIVVPKGDFRATDLLGIVTGVFRRLP